MNHELADIQAGFRKGRGTRDQIATICWIMEKAREFQIFSSQQTAQLILQTTVSDREALQRFQAFSAKWLSAENGNR